MKLWMSYALVDSAVNFDDDELVDWAVNFADKLADWAVNFADELVDWRWAGWLRREFLWKIGSLSSECEAN